MEAATIQTLKAHLDVLTTRFEYDESGYLNGMKVAEKHHQLWSTKLAIAESDLKISTQENEYLNHIASVCLTPPSTT